MTSSYYYLADFQANYFSSLNSEQLLPLLFNQDFKRTTGPIFGRMSVTALRFSTFSLNTVLKASANAMGLLMILSLKLILDGVLFEAFPRIPLTFFQDSLTDNLSPNNLFLEQLDRSLESEWHTLFLNFIYSLRRSISPLFARMRSNSSSTI